MSVRTENEVGVVGGGGIVEGLVPIIQLARKFTSGERICLEFYFRKINL